MKPYYSDELVTLYCGDFREVLPRLKLQVPLIVTDPPYPKQYLPLYGDLARVGGATLEDGGSLLTLCGHSYLPEVFNLMTPHVRFHHILSYLQPGGESGSMWARKVNPFWKPCLWFCNGQYTGKWVGDVIRSDRNDKRFHHWGQSVGGMLDLLQKFITGDETILDPFAGGGATLKAAKILGLPSIGIELLSEKCATIAQRLSQVAPAMPGQTQLGFERLEVTA